MDSVCKINKAEQHLDKLPPETKEYFEFLIAEARQMMIVREVCAGNILIDEDELNEK